MPGFTLDPGADMHSVSSGLAALERSLTEVSHPLTDRVMIVAGEIAANASEHGLAPLGIQWTITPQMVTLDLSGSGPDAQKIAYSELPGPEATRGRGLYLIRTLASSIEDGPEGLRIRLEAEQR
jgi:anti-sigma regulatory factor (Ser/Thr protein kinase)